MPEVTLADLKRTYSEKADEELLGLHARGTLTETAYEALEAELARRGVPVPPRPQAIEPFPKRMTREERMEGMKSLAMTLSPVPVVGLAAPLINAYCSSSWIPLALLALLAPMILFMRGLSVLLHPATAAARPRALRLGAMTAALSLATAPESIRLGLLYVSSRPKSIAFALAGTVAMAAYLWFARRYWPSMRNGSPSTEADGPP